MISKLPKDFALDIPGRDRVLAIRGARGRAPSSAWIGREQDSPYNANSGLNNGAGWRRQETAFGVFSVPGAPGRSRRSRRFLEWQLLGGLVLFTAASLGLAVEPNQTSKPESEIPPTFRPRTEGFDYVVRREMIPMRDGVKLYTVIIIPRGAQRAPMLLTRTPYGAEDRITEGSSKHLATLIGSRDVADELVVSG